MMRKQSREENSVGESEGTSGITGMQGERR